MEKYAVIQSNTQCYTKPVCLLYTTLFSRNQVNSHPNTITPVRASCFISMQSVLSRLQVTNLISTRLSLNYCYIFPSFLRLSPCHPSFPACPPSLISISVNPCPPTFSSIYSYPSHTIASLFGSTFRARVLWSFPIRWMS